MQFRRSNIAAFISVLTLLAFCAAAYPEKQPPSKPIDLNLANMKELQELPGVGPVTAQRIIDLRAKSGRFKRVEDLLAVRGINRKKLDALRPYVTVSAPPAFPSTKMPASPAKKSPGAAAGSGHE